MNQPGFKRFLKGPLAALAWVVLFGCILSTEKVGDNKEARRGSEVENEIYGQLVDEHGSPLIGATVKAQRSAVGIGKITAGVLTKSDSVTTVTDSTGRYYFNTLSVGNYDLFGEYQSGALVVLIPGVVIQDTSVGFDIGIDTLREPGRIRGRLLLGDKGKGEVLAYIPGTSYLSISNDTGGFTLSGVPQGRYSVSYALAGYVLNSDTGVMVHASTTTDLPLHHLSYDTVQNPPPPLGFTADYDTLSGIVKLKWNSVPVSDLLGYLVYRAEGSDALPVALNTKTVIDTFYSDTLAALLSDGKTKTMTYRLKTIDKGLNSSIIYSLSKAVIVVPPAFISTALSIRTVPDQIVGTHDTLRFIGSINNPSRINRKINWFLDQGAEPVQSKEVAWLSGLDTLTWSGLALGTHTIRLEAIDNTGRKWMSTTYVTVVEEPPNVESVTLDAVSVGDTVTLQGSHYATDRFGSLVKFEWDIGASGHFITAPGGDFSFVALAVTNDTTIPCVLRVTDNDGMQDQDTVWLQIVLDNPTARITGNPLEAYAGDTLTFSGVESFDGMGRIVKWEWDIGKPGLFISRPDTQITFTLPDTAISLFTCLLKVTDNSGQSAIDSVSIQVRAKGQWKRVTRLASPLLDRNGPFTMGSSDTNALVLTAMQDQTYYPWRLWRSPDMVNWENLDIVNIPGNRDISSPVLKVGKTLVFFLNETSTSKQELWSSTDEMNWALLSKPDFLEGRVDFQTVVYAGKLWVIGGRKGNEFMQDIWNSSNGVNWTLITSSTELGARVTPQITVYANKMWLYGGKGIGFSEEVYRDIWSSSDGAHWIQVKDTVNHDGSFKTFLTHGGQLWLLGSSQGATTSSSSIWNSTDGVSWTMATQDPGFTAADRGEFLDFNGRLWMIGTGSEFDQSTNRGDIWLAPYP